MADLLIAPEGYTTPGGVPRKLLAGVFLVVTLTASAAFMATSSDQPLLTGDQKARAELQKPESVSSQARGNAQWVDDAADRARTERTTAAASAVAPPMALPVAVTPGAAVASPATGPGMPSLPGFAARPANASPASPPPLPPAAQRQAGGTHAAEADAGAIERDRASRTVASTVFDEGTGAPAKDARVDALPGEPLRRVSAGVASGAEALAPVIDAIKAMHAQPAPGGAAGMVPPQAGRAEGDRQWARQQSVPGGADVLTARPPGNDLMLFQGTVIPAVLARRVNSDMPGVITARVSMDVYDSRTSRRLLLPKGALLVGAYNSDVQAGQSRVQFAFTRLKMPDGSTFDLPGATGSDAAGQAGVEGDVDRHFFRSFGSALLMGVLADRVTKITALPNGGLNGQGGLSATGQVFVDTARAELERHRSIPPTVTLEEGMRINVEVVRDMGFANIYREQGSW